MTLDEKLAKLEWNDYLGPPPSYNTLDALFRVCKSQGWEVVLIQYTDGWSMASLRNMNMVRYNESPVQALRNAIEKVVG